MNGPATSPADGRDYVLSEDELDDVTGGRSPAALIEASVPEFP